MLIPWRAGTVGSVTATVTHRSALCAPVMRALRPFSTQASLEAWHQVARLRWVHGALALALRQAAYVGASPPHSEAGSTLLQQLTDLIPPVDPDRPLDQEVRMAGDAVYAIADSAA